MPVPFALRAEDWRAMAQMTPEQWTPWGDAPKEHLLNNTRAGNTTRDSNTTRIGHTTRDSNNTRVGNLTRADR